MSDQKRLLVTGSRDWDDWESMENHLRSARQELGTDKIILVHGGARGADFIANKIWLAWGLPVESHRADWAKFGAYAGPKRNKEMVALGADLCLAFPIGRSKGTRGCVREAEGAGIPVKNNRRVECYNSSKHNGRRLVCVGEVLYGPF